jgi:hypothetical protein
MFYCLYHPLVNAKVFHELVSGFGGRVLPPANGILVFRNVGEPRSTTVNDETLLLVTIHEGKPTVSLFPRMPGDLREVVNTLVGFLQASKNSLADSVPCGERGSQPDQARTVLRRKLVHERNSRELRNERKKELSRNAGG